MESLELLAEAPDWINYDLPRASGRHRLEGKIPRPDAEMVRLPLPWRRDAKSGSIRRPAATKPNSTVGTGGRWAISRADRAVQAQGL